VGKEIRLRIFLKILKLINNHNAQMQYFENMNQTHTLSQTPSYPLGGGIFPVAIASNVGNHMVSPAIDCKADRKHTCWISLMVVGVVAGSRCFCCIK
jgi:hypothetical protein